jgi:FtsH-binding integral membrane protein
MDATGHSDLPARRYGPHYAHVGLLLVVVSIPTDILLSLLADHAPSAQTSSDLHQFGVTSLLALAVGIGLCLRGLLSQRDRSHRAASALGLVVAGVWIAAVVALSLAS